MVFPLSSRIYHAYVLLSEKLPVLRGTPEAIRQLRETLSQPQYNGLTSADFSDLAQGCKTYGEFIEKMAQTPESALWYFGIAFCGPRKKVDCLTGSIPLLR